MIQISPRLARPLPSNGQSRLAGAGSLRKGVVLIWTKTRVKGGDQNWVIIWIMWQDIGVVNISLSATAISMLSRGFLRRAGSLASRLMMEIRPYRKLHTRTSAYERSTKTRSSNATSRIKPLPSYLASLSLFCCSIMTATTKT